jgi:putative redox protein
MTTMDISFPGGKRVDCSFDGFTVKTDQSPRGGGEGSAPEPFSLFLASLATCAGIYVLGFCQARNIPTEGIRLTQESTHEDGRLKRVQLVITLPPSFPEKYVTAVKAAANGCKVKKTLADPPEILVDAITSPQPELAAAAPAE